MKKLVARYDSGAPWAVMAVWTALFTLSYLVALSLNLTDPASDAKMALPLLVLPLIVGWLAYRLKPHEVEIEVEGEYILITHCRLWGRHTRRVRYEVGDVLNFAVFHYELSLFSSFTGPRGGKVMLRRGMKHIKLFVHEKSRQECARVVVFLREQTGLADHTCFAQEQAR